MVGVFLVHTLECGIGGMETHQRAFISYYTNHTHDLPVNFKYIVENKGDKLTLFFLSKGKVEKHLFEDFTKLERYLKKNIFQRILFFLNDGWWIESISELRTAFPKCCLYLRSGGNDAELAPWNKGSFSYSQRRELWKNSILKLDFIIANSDYSVSRLLDMGIPHNLIYKVRGGVNESLCRECKSNRHLLRQNIIKTYSIRQKYLLVFATRFVPFKGIIPALRHLQDSKIKNQCHILFVGTGLMEYEIKEWCKKNLKENQYSFIGEKSNEDTIRIIASSDILFNPSIYYKAPSGDGQYIHTETMGRSMMEAISVGTKILATDVGGTKELFSENHNGIGKLISPDLDTLIEDLNNIDIILDRKTDYVCDYSWNYVFEQYNKLFLR